MKKTIENKIKFFALYLDQEVAILHNYSVDKSFLDITLLSDELQMRRTSLGLKSLKSISDEDAINGAITLQGIKVDNEIIDIKRHNDLITFNIIHKGCNFISSYSFFHYASNPNRLSLNYTDYLRSKGYALPYMGLSVETMVEYGWIKLKSE